MDYLIVLKGCLEVLGLASCGFFGSTFAGAIFKHNNWLYPVVFFLGSILFVCPPWEGVL
jgi:hypothetical protein